MINTTAQSYGSHLEPAVQNVIQLTLSFAKAVGDNQDNKQDNLVVSPYNYIRFLSMLSKGTEGDTKEELAQVLFNVSKDNLDTEIDKILTLNRDMLEANKDQVELTTATGFWANSDNIKLNDDFAEELEKLFETRVSSDSFSANPTAVLQNINDWADKSTNGLIKSIIDQIEPDMAAILASALYFKGKWTNKFDKDLTEDKDFTSDNGDVLLTKTMLQDFSEDNVKYQEGNDYESVALTYGENDYQKGKQPTMRIVLVRPKNENQSARDWMASQADGTVPAWLDPYIYEGAQGVVELPRMDIEQTHQLNKPLIDAGLKNLLGPGADFSKMIDVNSGNIELSQVKEDIVFKTDEVGSEAASIVSGVMRTLSALPMPKRRIHVEFNRSFVMAVQDIKTGAVLFAGAVNKPNNEMKKPRSPSP